MRQETRQNTQKTCARKSALKHRSIEKDKPRDVTAARPGMATVPSIHTDQKTAKILHQIPYSTLQNMSATWFYSKRHSPKGIRRVQEYVAAGRWPSCNAVRTLRELKTWPAFSTTRRRSGSVQWPEGAVASYRAPFHPSHLAHFWTTAQPPKEDQQPETCVKTASGDADRSLQERRPQRTRRFNLLLERRTAEENDYSQHAATEV